MRSSYIRFWLIQADTATIALTASVERTTMAASLVRILKRLSGFIATFGLEHCDRTKSAGFRLPIVKMRAREQFWQLAR